MTADAWVFYNTFKLYEGDGTIDLDSDTFRMLLTSSSYTPSADHTVLADITNELTGNGYARYALTQTWTRSGGTVTFDTDNAQFDASGGAITARYAVIYDDTPTAPADPLVAYCLLDNSPADVSAPDGTPLIVRAHADGIYSRT